MICMTLAVLDPHSLVSYGPFTEMLVWSVFFEFYQNVCCFIIGM